MFGVFFLNEGRFSLEPFLPPAFWESTSQTCTGTGSSFSAFTPPEGLHAFGTPHHKNAYCQPGCKLFSFPEGCVNRGTHLIGLVTEVICHWGERGRNRSGALPDTCGLPWATVMRLFKVK